ncbi:hypothetical protein ACLB1Q_25605 [Escherichia coli]
MTDCSTPEDGLACQAGEPKLLALRFLAIPRLKRQLDLALVKTLSDAGCRVIAEGRYNTPVRWLMRCATARGR